MLRGQAIRLRTIREADLDRVYELHHDLGNRGDYFPLGVLSEPAFKNAFREGGFWRDGGGMLLIVDGSDANEILGHVEYFRTVSYLDELELSFVVYAHEMQGRGVATEAVRLMSDYLFAYTRTHRIRLIIHPDNAASKRVAEKCGYHYESTARQAWFHQGRHHDVEVFARLRQEGEGVDR